MLRKVEDSKWVCGLATFCRQNRLFRRPVTDGTTTRIMSTVDKEQLECCSDVASDNLIAEGGKTAQWVCKDARLLSLIVVLILQQNSKQGLVILTADAVQRNCVHGIWKRRGSCTYAEVHKVRVMYPTWPRGVQEVKAPRFLDIRHMKVVRSSPLRTGRLYPHILVLIFRGWVDPGHMDLSDASEKIPSDTTGDRTRDLPTSLNHYATSGRRSA